MRVDDVIKVFAGTMIVSSVLLSVLFSQYWLILTAFVGVNLFQYGFSGFCPLALVLTRLGVPK